MSVGVAFILVCSVGLFFFFFSDTGIKENFTLGWYFNKTTLIC